MTCTSPCTISGLDPGTEYQFVVIPNNNYGSSTGCTGKMTGTFGLHIDVIISVPICTICVQ